MKRRERHPRITPLRALELLRELDFNRHNLTGTPLARAVDEGRAALASHVRAALVRRKP